MCFDLVVQGAPRMYDPDKLVVKMTLVARAAAAVVCLPPLPPSRGVAQDLFLLQAHGVAQGLCLEAYRLIEVTGTPGVKPGGPPPPVDRQGALSRNQNPRQSRRRFECDASPCPCARAPVYGGYSLYYYIIALLHPPL